MIQHIMLARRSIRANKSAEQLALEEFASQSVMHKNNIRFVARLVIDFLNSPDSLFWREIMETDVKLFGWRDLKLLHQEFSR